MPQIVEVPGLGEVEFPDDTPRTTMEAAINRALIERAGRPQAEQAPARLPGAEFMPPTALEKIGEQVKQFAAPAILPIAGGLAGAAAGTALGGPPGLVIGESVGSAGGEALSQALGISDPSVAQIGLAAIAGPAARGTLGIAKGIARGSGALLLPQQFRLAGTELAEQTFRGPESRGLFEIARRSGNVPTAKLAGIVDAAANAERAMSTPSKKALQLLNNLRSKLSKTPATSYDDLINEVQRLNQQAKGAFRSGDNVLGARLSDASKQILSEMDAISPALRGANAAYRREQNVVKLADILSKGNPSAELRKIIRHDSLFGEGFSAQELKLMTDIIDRLGRFPGQALGLGRVSVQAVFEPVAEFLANPTGRAILQQTLKSPGRPATLWSATVQAARAWQASRDANMALFFLGP